MYVDYFSFIGIVERVGVLYDEDVMFVDVEFGIIDCLVEMFWFVEDDCVVFEGFWVLWIC